MEVLLAHAEAGGKSNYAEAKDCEGEEEPAAQTALDADDRGVILGVTGGKLDLLVLVLPSLFYSCVVWLVLICWVPCRELRRHLDGFKRGTLVASWPRHQV